MSYGVNSNGGRIAIPAHLTSLSTASQPPGCRGEIIRLTRLRSQHGESQYRIRSQTRHLKEEIPVLAQRIENLKLDMAVRKDTHGDAFEIEIAKSNYKDRAITGNS